MCVRALASYPGPIAEFPGVARASFFKRDCGLLAVCILQYFTHSLCSFVKCWQDGLGLIVRKIMRKSVNIFIKFNKDSWRKFKRNEYLISVCKSVRDSSWFTSTSSSFFSAKIAHITKTVELTWLFRSVNLISQIKHSHPIFTWYKKARLRLKFVYQTKISCHVLFIT